ncbi:cysteine--tRNA ligase [Candidatus Uhrbacteria bacterium]|nr:cysteine--tRNA ligase [Candidatus Uhrbacteria bacterium]
MTIVLTNTLTRAKEEFRPIIEGKAGIYSCGPTVYGRASIGNFRAFIFADVLRRMLAANGIGVTQVMNITDVGHLVGDGDEGEDKLQMSADTAGKTAWDIAAEYTQLFMDDLRRVNMLTPHVMPRATDHIGEQIAMIEAMELKGFTYATRDGIYFATAKLPDYGRLSGQKSEEKEEGARIGVNLEKRNPSDFALWKFSPEGAKRHMEWESPWGKGFPGWHIECSAMSEKYLGVPFDIHTGGADHVAVHHENEIAQTMAARGVLEANYWLHNEFLLIDGGKMSKSLGNVYSLDDLAAKGISALGYRYFVLGAHYRTQQNFTWDAATAAEHALNKLVDVARTWEKPSAADEATTAAFMEHVNNDLDTPGALAVLWTFVNDAGVQSDVKAATVLAMDEVLGLALEDVVARPIRMTDEAQKLLDERQAARAAKDWGKSDALRDQLAELGYLVEDTAEGQRVREKRY